MAIKKSYRFSTGRRHSLVKSRIRRGRGMRGGYGFSVNVNGADRIGGQSEILRYSQCPGADPLSKDYGTALYSSNGGNRRSVRRSKRLSNKHTRKQRKQRK
jgi:hypothetical protein